MAVPIKEEAKGIFRIGPSESAGPGRATHYSHLTSPFLVVGERQAAVLEPGEDVQIPTLMEGIKQLGVTLDRVAYVWASHIHLHHIQCLPQLMPQLPQAKFVVHPRGAPHVIEPTRLVQSTIQVWGGDCYGPFAGLPRDRVMTVEDGQVIDLGGRDLEIVYAPGHAPHHMGLFDRQTKVLFPGDLGYGAGSFGGQDATSPTVFSVEAYIMSMRRYQALNPSLLLCFGQQNIGMPVDSLRNAEVDTLAAERIALEGMRQNLTYAEIQRRVGEFNNWVGSVDFEARERGGVGERTGRARGGGAPPHLLAYIKRKHPELEMPKDIVQGITDTATRRRR